MKNSNTIWYHGTSRHAWDLIQKEGFLLGVNKDRRRFTFLSKDKDEARMYGDILLKVEYDPISDLFNNNFGPENYQEIKVTSPIHLSKIKKV